MAIYYNCKRTDDDNSFEVKLCSALMRKKIDIWSTSIPLDISGVIDSGSDDKYGNTSYALFVVDCEYIHDRRFRDDLTNILQYPTIKIMFVLYKYEIDDFKSFIQEQFSTINLSNSNIEIKPVQRLTGGIITSIAISLTKENINRNNNKISTGIDTLDFLLDGGLRPGTSFNIIGPKGCGKTTLGVQIQKNILESGRGCLFITYSEHPSRIFEKFESFNFDIDKYIENNKFKIYDSYSSLNGLSEEDVKNSIGENRYKAIVRVADPTDFETYFDKQIETIKSIGPGGFNVIDEVNDRYELSKKQKTIGGITYKQHFAKFKAMAGGTLHHIGAHIVTSDIDDNSLITHLTREEDGSIIMNIIRDVDGNEIKALQVKNIGRGDSQWYEYVINDNGISILRCVEEN